MSVERRLAGGMLLAAALSVLSSAGYGAQYLTVNGGQTEEILMAVSQTVTIEINSTDSDTYLTLIGFESETPEFDLVLTEIRPEAGTSAMADLFNEPGILYGYGVSTLGGLFSGPISGTHFVFELTALQQSEADLVLLDLVTIIDGIHIIATSDPGPDLTDGLLGYWPMEDGFGNTATDRSGNANHGTLSGGSLPLWRPSGGILGGMLYFDGSGGYVNCGNNPAFDMTEGCTVMAWIMVRSFTKDWQAITTKGDSAWRLHRHQNTDYINFACTGLIGGNKNWGSTVWGSTPVRDNEWHHAAGIYDPSDEADNVKLYIDGVIDGAEALRYGNGPIATNSYDVLIGENAQQTGREWHGLIDDVRLYDRPWSADKIYDYANFGIVPAGSPVAHWELDEASGTIAPDSSGNGYDATLVGRTGPEWRTGPNGGALEFHGVGSYVNCSNSPIFDVTDALSVSAWINITTVPADWAGIITKGDDAWRFSTFQRTTSLHFAVTGPPDYWAVNGQTQLNPGQWYNVAATYDGTEIRLYVDGVEDAIATAYDGGVTTDPFDVWIGGNSDRPGREFDGLIDEVAVWNRALSINEIQWLAENQVIPRNDIYVDDDALYDPAPGDPTVSDPDENGTWEHPFDSIQKAIDSAAGPATVVVLDGMYTGRGNRAMSFNGNNMTVRSENGPENCIIDCQNADRAFLFWSEETPASVLDGFTIVNGAPFTEIWNDGGAIYCWYSSPTISNCIIKDCTAGLGGGIYLFNSNSTVRNCLLAGNTSMFGGAGGMECQDSNPTIFDCTVENNNGDGVRIDSGTASIWGTVNIRSDILSGDGNFHIDPDAVLQMEDAGNTGNITGLGGIFVPPGKRLTIGLSGTIDLTDPAVLGMQGTLQCDGLLIATGSAALTRTTVNVTRAIFEGQSVISENVFNTNALIPYGQISLEETAAFFDNDVYAFGDRYIDVESDVFAGTIANNRIYVTVEEGSDGKAGGLFELRGQDMFCQAPPCEPGMFAVQIVPDFDPVTWTVERLELVEGAELTLTNRDNYRPPYDEDDRTEVLYVKQLVLGPNSVLDTAYNRMYYESLTMHPTAKVINRALLGYSLDHIVFDHPDEYLNRVANNNFADTDNPSLERIHVERVVNSELDPTGLMIMHTLPDPDPNSPTYQQILPARAKGLFARSSEEMLTIRFKYIFETFDPNVKLEVYLSDTPDLMDKTDPERLDHYTLVAVLTPPPARRPGSAGSERFAVFDRKVPTDDLDLTDGAYLELELLDLTNSNVAIPSPGSSFPKNAHPPAKDNVAGTSVTIDDWGPEVHCDGICLDVTRDALVNEVDFLTVIGECGLVAELDPCDTGSRACLEGAFSDDGYVNTLDITGWDWSLGDEDRTYLCDGIPLSDTEGAPKSADPKSAGKAVPKATLPPALDDLLIIGKRKSAAAADKMQDRIYMFDADGNYNDWFASSSIRYNLRIVRGSDDKLYQINAEDGVVVLDATDKEIIPPGVCTDITEPRHGTSGATVYVGIKLEPGQDEDESVGRPILDAAFDEDYVYVVPVVVNPVGKDSYTAAARLQLLGSGDPPYTIDKLYDDPPLPADNQYRNSLREIEIDDAGNIYVINAHNLNESNILWRYDPSGAFQRIDLGVPATNNYVPDPVALYLSETTDMLYMASGQHDSADYRDSSIYGFTTQGTINRTRTIIIQDMHHVTGITEDPNSGILYVVGFNMDNIPQHPDETALPFYEARFARIPPYDNASVTAQAFAGAHNLALPLAVLWTKPINCAGANIAGGDTTVNFLDVAAFAQYWLNSPCTPPDWCGQADIDMSGKAGFPDVEIIANQWLKTDCTD